ncbi:hypothetical protein SCLCIDRAFT_1217763 [Scleroderma citrinum Foug A]|uniref:DUF6533 domain-containing protein n=1 Tax=Scleroderma citrinum Foug A TaxID=1036808 RepID=A0A0C3DTX5_9AGAM|nr:hypothetical protein SCLCIDRAFT_1217763 [Scleroderma citrinum Foug A]
MSVSVDRGPTELGVPKELVQQRYSQLMNASITLLAYDHATSLGDEIEYFWKGPWNLSRCLYLGIRCLALVYVIIQLWVDFDSPAFASAMIATSLTMILLGLLCQAALTIRVWYLFPKYPLIRTSVVSAYVSCTIATCVVIGLSEKYIYADTHSTTVNQDGASVIAAIYIPFLVLDIFLFVLKVYMLATSPAYMKRDTFVSRFMKEGMVMFAVNIGALVFSVVDLTMTPVSNLPTYTVALSGSVAVTTSVLSVCRPMLSLHSLAATHGVSPCWLFSRAELSRVDWTEGTKDGEILVEVEL